MEMNLRNVFQRTSFWVDLKSITLQLFQSKHNLLSYCRGFLFYSSFPSREAGKLSLPWSRWQIAPNTQREMIWSQADKFLIVSEVFASFDRQWSICNRILKSLFPVYFCTLDILGEQVFYIDVKNNYQILENIFICCLDFCYIWTTTQCSSIPWKNRKGNVLLIRYHCFRVCPAEVYKQFESLYFLKKYS